MITVTLQASAELLNVLQRLADSAEDLVRIYADQLQANAVPETTSSAGATPPAQAEPAGDLRADDVDVSSQKTAQPARVPNEPTAPAAASSPASIGTPERKALLARMWPAGEPADKVLVAVNALPGKHIPDIRRLGILAASWGFKRPPGYRPTVTANPPPVAPAAKARGPVDADIDQVRTWALQRGVGFTGPGDVEQVNAKRRHLGLAPFNLVRRRAKAA